MKSNVLEYKERRMHTKRMLLLGFLSGLAVCSIIFLVYTIVKEYGISLTDEPSFKITQEVCHNETSPSAMGLYYSDGIKTSLLQEHLFNCIFYQKDRLQDLKVDYIYKGCKEKSKNDIECSKIKYEIDDLEKLEKAVEIKCNESKVKYENAVRELDESLLPKNVTICEDKEVDDFHIVHQLEMTSENGIITSKQSKWYEIEQEYWDSINVISKEYLTIDWLNENCKCYEWCDYELYRKSLCYNSVEDSWKDNDKIDNLRCSKYKCGEYQIEVLQ